MLTSPFCNLKMRYSQLKNTLVPSQPDGHIGHDDQIRPLHNLRRHLLSLVDSRQLSEKDSICRKQGKGLKKSGYFAWLLSLSIFQTTSLKKNVARFANAVQVTI